MNPAHKFTLLSFVFATAIAGISDYAAVSLFKTKFVEFAARQSADLLQIQAFKELEPLDFTTRDSGPDSDGIQKKFRTFFEAVRSSGVARMEAWNPAGKILFFSDPTLPPNAVAENGKFRKALSGTVTWDTPMRFADNGLRVIEVWVPIFFPNKREASGVIRTLVDVSEINILAYQTHALIAVIFLVGFFTYWLVGASVFKNIVLAPMRNFEYFKLVAEHASDHIILTDREGVILYANKAAEKITGYTVREIIGSRPSLWGRRMSSEFYRKLWRVIKDEQKTFVGEIENQKKNGETYLARVTITPVVENGKAKFFVGVEHDITEEKEKEKMRAQFMALASHQLRTPLSGTKWLIETLRKGIAGQMNEKQKEYIDILYGINEKMIALVSDMLHVLRWESGQAAEPEIIDIDALFHEITAKFEPVIKERNIILESDFTGRSGWKILAVKQFFCAILENILSNAIVYSRPGQKVLFNIAEEDGVLAFSIRDSGIGIPREEQKKISEKFYRASNAVHFRPEGTGLGFSIAAELAKKIGATIAFQSQENIGSTFFVRIPKFVSEYATAKSLLVCPTCKTIRAKF